MIKNIKNNTTHKNNNTKTTKKIINWSEYNNSLVNRGNISIYISDAISNKAFLKPQKTHKVGHPIDYSDDLILLVLTIRELFRLPLRQATGFSQYLLKTSSLIKYNQNKLKPIIYPFMPGGNLPSW